MSDQNEALRVDAVLVDIMRRKRLDHPDGRALYGYRTRGADLSQLGLALHRRLERGLDLTPQECAGLVLYLSERFCALHEGGAWKWDTVLRELGLGLTGPELYEAFERGLGWWKRRLILVGGRRRFLVTLACEGGLPLALLRKGHTHLRRFFSRLLRDREEFPELDLLESARARVHVLPTTLRNEDLCAYAALLIDAVADLRKQCRGVEDPLGHLDRTDPHWRNRVPLRLDEDKARLLLDGLLRAPSASVGRVEEELLLQTVLEFAPRPTLRRVPLHPSTLRWEALARYLGQPEDELPARLRLASVGDDGVEVQFARVTRLQGGEECRLEPTPGAALRDPRRVRGEVRVLASSHSGSYHAVPIAGGEALDEQLPWVFSDLEGDSDQRLLAVGSARTRGRGLVVALPAGATLESGEREALGELPGYDRSLWRVRGDVKCAGVDWRVRLRTGDSEAGDQTRYVLRGPNLVLGTGGSAVWCGPPELQARNEDGDPLPLDPNEVQWRIDVGPSAGWGVLGPGSRGSGRLRVVRDGEVCFQTRLTIVERSFGWSSAPGEQDGTGTVTVEGQPLRARAAESTPGCSFDCEASGDRGEIRCRLGSGAPRPAYLGFSAVLGDGSRARLWVPFPARQIAFVDASGRTLEADCTLSVDDLLGVRARVVTPRSSDSYYVEARTYGSATRAHVATPRVRMGDLGNVGNGVKELVLDRVTSRIQQLFDADDDIETTVELRIAQLGPEVGGAPRLTIRRFVSELEFRYDDAERETRVGLRHGDRVALDPEVISVRVQPVWNPAAHEEHLARVPEAGEWTLALVAHDGGPWLATVWEDERLIARPALVPKPALEVAEIPAEPTDEELGSARLAQVARMSPPALARGIRAVLEKLSGHPEDPDWELAEAYLASLERLPSNTFHFVRELARHPDAAAAAALRCASEPWFPRLWRGLEQLPFLWALVPYESWRNAARAECEHLRVQFLALDEAVRLDIVPEEVVRDRLESLRAKTAVRAPFMDVVVDALRTDVLGDPRLSGILLSLEREDGRRALEEELDHEWNHLRIRHAHEEREDWPREELHEVLREAGLNPDDQRIPRRRPPLPHLWSALNAPAAAAAMLAFGVPVEHRAPPVGFQRLRAFDPIWFDIAHHRWIALLLGKRLGEPHEKRSP